MRQCFAWWSFTYQRDIAPAAFLEASVRTGIDGVEMLPQQLWPVAKDVGLTLVTVGGHEPLELGFNDPARHAALQDQVRRTLETCAKAGVPNVIVFSGNRDGRSDADGISACAAGLAPLAEEAHAAGITLVLELLNSKVDHRDYHCDHTWWGAEVVRRVGSPGLRLLFDAYHMQLMEGNLSLTIREHIERIGHIHTAGVPGRRDLDAKQEVNWPAIGALLRKLDYRGWVGHEFLPKDDPLTSLAHAVKQFMPQPWEQTR